MVRLWVSGEDFGTMSETAAEVAMRAYRHADPTDVCHTEPVDDDAPVFLERA
jgi:hypothetical protein